MSQLKYPLDFFVQLLIWIIYTFIPIIGTYFMLDYFGEVGNFRKEHIFFLMGIVGISYDISRMIGRGFDNFHNFILQGDLDILLVRSVNLKLQIMESSIFLRRLSGIVNYIIIIVISLNSLIKQIYFDTWIIVFLQ